MMLPGREPAGECSGNRPLEILIVTEHDGISRMVRSLLAGDGHRSRSLPAGKETVRAILASKPDLLIIDVSPENSEALEVYRRLQCLRELRLLPVIVLSDYPELEYELLRVFDFLAKPVDLDRLREDIRILQRGGTRRDPPMPPVYFTDDEHRLFHDYLLATSGLHFERRNARILERGVQNRMAALHIGSYTDYYQYLVRHRDNRQELQKLLQYLTVGETYFFRYNPHFRAIRRFLAGEAAKKERKLRFWSAGCSSGEEAYSLAMTIMEAMPDWRRRDIRIYATDINNRALQRGRDGVYTPWSMRVTDEEYVQRYFERVGKSYLLKDEVKELVEFRHLNLQTDNFAAAEPFRDLDAIFCRNVMIYFSLPTTRTVVEKFAASLTAGGFLFLGHAETLANISSQFERHSLEGGFYYRKKTGSLGEREQRPVMPVVVPGARRKEPVRRELPAKPVQVPPARPVIPPAPAPDLEELFRQAQQMFEAEDFGGADALLDNILRHRPDHAGALVCRGFILANKGSSREALEHGERALAVDDLCAEAFFLKGVVLDMADSLEEAREEYRKAVLLRMDFVMPHYFLGRLLFRMGKGKEGLRALKTCLRLVEKTREESIVPYSGGLSREMLLNQLRVEMGRIGGIKGV